MDAPSVREVLEARLTTLSGAVRDADRAVRGEDPEGVHDLRVAMRRTRSLLTTFGSLLDAGGGQHLRQELRWAGHELGELRDLEVVHERIDRLLAAEPVELVLGRVVGRVADHRRENLAVERERAAALLADPRYVALLEELDALTSRPWPDRASAEEVRALLSRDWRRLRRRARRAAGQGADERAREEALHEVRKAAKRARYAAETLEPLFGRDAQRMAEAAERVQQTLGDHRDTLLTRPLLRQLGVQAHLEGDNGFSFGRLHAREQALGTAALDAYEEAVARVGRGRLRRWLRRPAATGGAVD